MRMMAPENKLAINQASGHDWRLIGPLFAAEWIWADWDRGGKYRTRKHDLDMCLKSPGTYQIFKNMLRIIAELPSGHLK